MSSKLKKFKILLDRGDDPTFSPGEIIAGRLIVEVDGSRTMRKSCKVVGMNIKDDSLLKATVGVFSLKVTIKGKAAVIFRDSVGSGRNKKTAHFFGEERYFSVDFYMLGQSDRGSVSIEAGSHEYPFEFCLPHNIPSSFDTSFGSVRYKVKAIMDVPWESEYKTSLAFTVNTPYDLTKCSNTMTAINDEEYTTFCCCALFDIGAMKVNIFLPTNSYTIGELIQAKININNTSTRVDVTKVKLQILQTTKLHSRFPHAKTKTLCSIVHETKERGPFRKRDEIVVGIQVPTLPYSNMIYCSLIDIKYDLKIIISVSGCHCDIDKTFPIVIGTVPILNAQLVENSATIAATVVPTEPPEAPTAMGRIPMPMPMPIERELPTETPTTRGIIPMPMPYSSTLGETASGNTRDERDSSYSFVSGNQPYPPVPFGFANSNTTQASTSTGSMMEPPPSYNEAMGMYARHQPRC